MYHKYFPTCVFSYHMVLCSTLSGENPDIFKANLHRHHKFIIVSINDAAGSPFVNKSLLTFVILSLEKGPKVKLLSQSFKLL